MFEFSPRFRALQREAGLTAQLLGSGVTTLRNANHAQDGYYNQSLFNLSIGLEHAAKLVLILDYCVNTKGKFPNDSELRKYGHDIQSLFAAMVSIRQKHKFFLKDTEYDLPNTEIHKAIRRVLAEFAKSSRYYNLDYLARGSASGEDPVGAWFARVGGPILLKHYPKQRQARDKRVARAAGRVMSDSWFVLHKSESGSPINSIAEMLEHGGKTAIVQKWGQFYTLQIIRYVAKLISELSYRAELCSSDVPHLIEFFSIFLNEDKYLQSRKTWSPYSL
jgi:hypothetical protein